MARQLTEENLEAEVDAAVEAATDAPASPRIVQAAYHRGLDLFELKLSDGRRLVYPREDLQALARSTPEQAGDFVVGQYGTDIWWPQLDEGHYLPNMLEGRTGNEKWMQKLRRDDVAA